jgi:cyanophycinase
VTTRLLRVALVAASIAACATLGGGSSTRVGPPRGSLMVVGGGALGSDIYGRFIQLAGGPDSLIVVIPTAGGAPAYTQDDGSAMAFRAEGARNVVVLHTTTRAVANSDSFVAPLRRAGGVWFPGGRHYRLVDSYAGTKSESLFHDVLARGGIVGGSSAGASIQGSFLVRGAPSNDNRIMAHPDYLKGFGFLRGVAIDQHVVARSRLPDLADSIIPRWPQLLGISEDEGTAWLVQGDQAEIIGRSKAFVYNGRDPNDAGKPFLTLRPGDRYDLAERRVISRAISGTPLTEAFVDSLFRAAGSAPATVLVARDRKVLVNKAYNVPPQQRHQPGTTAPNFDLGGIEAAMLATIAERSDTNGASFAQMVQRRVIAPAGMAATRVDTNPRRIQSNVDNLYRWDYIQRDTARFTVFGTTDGKRNAYVRDPATKTTILILTQSDSFDARGVAARIAERLR